MNFSVKEKSIFLGFVISILFSLTGFASKCDGIYDKVLRLHIIANSDLDFDQNLKLKVRDKILESTFSNFESAKNLDEAKKFSIENLKIIENIAKEEIFKNSCDYAVKAEIKKMYFKTRKYDKVTLPAGYYNAVRLTIGEGTGKNWWCVMFPPMCLPAAEEKEELADILTKTELELVENQEKYEIRFKCIEYYFEFKIWFGEIFEIFSEEPPFEYDEKQVDSV